MAQGKARSGWLRWQEKEKINDILTIVGAKYGE